MRAATTHYREESGPPERGAIRRGSFRKLGGLLLPLGALGVLVFFGVPTCPSRLLFGVPCPGCGLTRATLALLSLDVAQALSMHPLVFVITPLFAWALGRTVLVSSGFLRGGPGLLGRVPSLVWKAFLVILVGVWALRLAGALGGHPDPVDPTSGLLFGFLRLLPAG